MRKFNLFVAGIMALLSFNAVTAQQTNVNYTKTAPLVDGIKEAVWDKANVASIEKFEKGETDSTDLYAQFSTLWTEDDTTLHVFIEVTDDNTFLTNAWSSGDFVQVNIDLDNDDAEQYLYDDMFWMIRPSWNDSALVGRYGPNWEGLQQIPWHSAINGTNYTIELSIPLGKLGISNYNGNRTSIGFDIKVTDGDVVEQDTLLKDSELVWSSGAVWNNPSEMGTLILSGKPVPTNLIASTQYTENAPTIDGVIDDIWGFSQVSTTLEKVETGNPDLSDLSAGFTTLWTSEDTTLYVLIEVQDDNTYLTNAWSSGDFVQVNIDLDNDDAEQYLFDDMFWMIRPSWNDSALVGRYGPNWGDLPEINWHSTMEGTNYIIEMALPLADLGIANFSGNRTSIGFDIKVTDGDIEGQDTLAKKNELVWSSGEVWNNPSKMGTLILTGQPLEPTLSTTQYIENAPAIDGEKDELWSNAQVTTLGKVEKGNPDIRDLSANFSTLWTAEDTTLYVFIEVEDNQTFLTNAWSSGDFVQISIDLDNDDAEQYLFDDMFWMMRPSWNDSALVGRYGPNWGDLPVVNWSSAMEGTNYSIEMALPLAKLGLASFDGNGTTVGFDIKVTDGEITGQDTLAKKNELVWASGSSWNNPSVMGTLELKGAPDTVNYMQQAQSSILLYPNPVKNHINIISDITVKEVSVYDVAGKLLKTEKVSGKHLVIDVSSFNSGIYIIGTELKDGKKMFRKMMKQ